MSGSISTIQGGSGANFTPQRVIGQKKQPSINASDSSPTKTDKELSLKEQKKVDQLKSTDQEVKAHEQAHLSAAGGYALGGPSFTFVIGPDGKRYAVAGDVQVDVSSVQGDPQATIQKAEQIRKAAMAPANPSAQDQRVAANAASMINQARQELTQQQADSKGQNRLGSVLNVSA